MRGDRFGTKKGKSILRGGGGAALLGGKGNVFAVEERGALEVGLPMRGGTWKRLQQEKIGVGSRGSLAAEGGGSGGKGGKISWCRTWGRKLGGKEKGLHTARFRSKKGQKVGKDVRSIIERPSLLARGREGRRVLGTRGRWTLEGNLFQEEGGEFGGFGGKGIFHKTRRAILGRLVLSEEMMRAKKREEKL